VFTNGCFDILHVGHVRYLEEARTLGDVLIVGLNSDASFQQVKGRRPIIPQDQRAEMLEALWAVDQVILFDEPTPIDLIKKIQPYLLVKGGDHDPETVVGREHATKVLCLDVAADVHTSHIMERIKSCGDRAQVGAPAADKSGMNRPEEADMSDYSSWKDARRELSEARNARRRYLKYEERYARWYNESRNSRHEDTLRRSRVILRIAMMDRDAAERALVRAGTANARMKKLRAQMVESMGTKWVENAEHYTKRHASWNDQPHTLDEVDADREAVWAKRDAAQAQTPSQLMWRHLNSDDDVSSVDNDSLGAELFHLLGNAAQNADDTHDEGQCNESGSTSWCSMALASISIECSTAAMEWLKVRGCII
jgi:rfaE bifunctional protein nucleotidyltransferase chain/domain